MSKTKVTKHALLSSVLAMLLCLTMLIGTTFAWFTDTASTAVNKIQAGTLDVALEMKQDDEWVNAEGETLAWIKADGSAEVLWEPGCTYRLPELRVVNKGDIALKYKLIVTGIVGNAELLEVIDFTYGEDIDIASETFLAPDDAREGIIIEGHMAESAGNEYQGLSIDGIGITVVATQASFEYDSYDDQYDSDAEYPILPTSVSDFRDALTLVNSNIILADDITVEDGIQLSVLNDTSIDFNGNTLSGTLASGSILNNSGNTNLVLRDSENDGSYSVDGNIVIHEGGGMTQFAAVSAWQPTVTIESGKYTHDNIVIHCQLQSSDPNAVGFVINGGTFDGKGAASVVYNAFGNIIINGGTFNAYTDSEGNAGECLYVDYGNSALPSVTTINGGTFNAEKRIFYVDVDTDYTQKIIVTGGSFNVASGGSLIEVSSGNAEDYLTITGGTFNVDPTAYVDTATYNVTYTDSLWTVSAR